MFLIIGLGNPGEKYIQTRHNVGFQVLDYFRKENDFPDFRKARKFDSLISEKELEGNKVILIKPQTFMNNSGKAVKVLSNFYKITNLYLLVIHDDIDLLLGKIKISKARGSAGHKGVESIIKELKTKNFTRIRIGIQSETGKPKNSKLPSTRAKHGTGLAPHRNKVSGAGFVLQNFNKKEEKILKKVLKKSSKALKVVFTEGIEKAMTEFN